MEWLPIHAGQDHLARLARHQPVTGLTELIWNSLDAEATEVSIGIETASVIGAREAAHVTRITIRDNGHGITPAIAATAFPSLGDSWKRALKGRTLNDKRAIHGSLGRGRFSAYSLGGRVRWISVTKAEDGQRQRIEIEGQRDRIEGFRMGEPTSTNDPVGTTVIIDVGQDRTLHSLTDGDLAQRLAAFLGPHLLGNTDISVWVDGDMVDPRPLIEGEPTVLPLDSIPAKDLLGHEVPVLKIIDWQDQVRHAPGVLLCNRDGGTLFEIQDSAPQGTVRSTGYLQWSGWTDTEMDLSLWRFQHGSIVETGIKALAEHVALRTGALAVTIVATLKEKDAYPYPAEIADPVQEAERQLFDVVAVTARASFKNINSQQMKMTAKLFQLALQERPETLDLILAQTLELSEVERDELAALLRYSSLGAILGAAKEVARRLDLASALRKLVYDQDLSPAMREVDQLHPLVRDNVWLFGEAWRLSASETGLTAILRNVIGDDRALESELVRHGNDVRLPDGKRARVDLLLQRTRAGLDGKPERLVIELKRPAVRLGTSELSQVKGYAQALAGNAAAGPGRWTFWLVGSDTKDEIADELEQQGREWGHVIRRQNYDLWVTTWGHLLNQVEQRLDFYREQLGYQATQDESLKHVRQRHQELLPPEPPERQSPQTPTI
ncbi:MAG: ATP-binding protein [Acidimicrobiales bacterium]